MIWMDRQGDLIKRVS